MKFQTFESYNSRIKLVFVGDIMQHQNQLDLERERRWSYDGVFDSISPLLKDADLGIGNFETVLAGLKVVHQKPTQVPQFSAPDEFATALHRAGFDALSLVNNHMYDHDIGAHLRTAEILKSVGIIPISETLEMDVKGKPICFHPHTTEINSDESGNRPHQDLPKLNMDPHPTAFNIALMHWGGQFTGINDDMRMQCKYLVDKSFDMIIGSGPHIELPVEMIGDTLVAWSLGNCLSSHERHNADKPNRGILLEVTIGNDIQWNSVNIETIDNKIEITNI